MDSESIAAREPAPRVPGLDDGPAWAPWRPSWWHAWREQIDDGRRQRRFGFSRPRLLGATLAALAGVGGLAHLLTRAHVDAQAQALARQALEAVEAQIALADIELGRLSVQLASATGSDECSESLRLELAAASLTSDAVRRFGVVFADQPGSCLPDGALAWAPVTVGGQESLLRVTRDADGAPWTLLWSGHARLLEADGVLVFAMLDPRALRPGGVAAPVDAGDSDDRLRVTVRDSHGRALGPVAAAPRADDLPVLIAAPASRYGLSADVAAAPVLLAGATGRRALQLLPLAALLMAGIVTLAWRRAIVRSRLSFRLQGALRRRQFEPFVQPIVDLRDGRCVGAEVLMRWRHPHRGMLGPGEFIEEAERTGLIGPMSDLIMGRAAHRLAPLLAEYPELYVSFNVAPQQLRHADFAQRLARTFGPDTIPRERVLLEVTERDVVDGQGARALAELHAQGWRVAVDDFGTGHSSLAALEKLPIDRIKIDRAFVASVDDRTVSRPVLDAIITLAERMGVPLIAEGVETGSQWDYLAARGVGHAQGFLMARPMPIDAFAGWLAARRAEVAPAQAAATATARAPGLRVDARTGALLRRMRMPGGVDVRDRMFHLQAWRQCFVGREAVDWIVQHEGISRDDAVALGRRMMALDLVRHVRHEHDFEDAHLFYCFSDDAAPPPVAAASCAALRLALRSPDGPAVADHARGLMLHRACLRGRDLVDWIVQRQPVTRAGAVQWAAQLMREGALRHVYDDEPFRDDATLYRLTGTA